VKENFSPPGNKEKFSEVSSCGVVAEDLAERFFAFFFIV